MKLPITLATITHNAGPRLKELIEAHRDIVSEVVVIDQGSTDGTYEVAKELADFAIQKRCKGFVEPDRNYLINLAKQPFILMLDDDEKLPDETKKALPDLLKHNLDVYWLICRHLVDGVDISEITGIEYHPRLFKAGGLRWSDQMHVYPTPKPGVKTMYTNCAFDHIRSYDKMVASNKAREAVATPDKIKLQNEFIQSVTNLLQSKGLLKAGAV